VIAAGDARKFLGDTAFASLTIKRQAVLINMAFNLGINRLRTFKLFKQALLDGDYAEAKVQMLSSKWAGQVKGRAIRLADMMFAD
jgi:lysozyme